VQMIVPIPLSEVGDKRMGSVKRVRVAIAFGLRDSEIVKGLKATSIWGVNDIL